MELPSPTPRRVGTPSWLDRRFVFGVVLVLAAVLLGARVVAASRHTVPRVAVTGDLAAGTTLRAADLRLVDVQLPDGGDPYVSDTTRAVGRALTQPVTAGQLLPVAALGDGRTRTTVSVPFPAGAAPRLSRGERLVVWLSTPACPSVRLLDEVAVDEVDTDATSFAAGGTGQDAVLSVSPQLADRVIRALAIDGATIRAGVLSGPAAPTATLPPLAGCAAARTP